MTTSKAHPLLLLADKYSIKVLRKTCIDYMSNHIVQYPDTNRTLTWYTYAKITNSEHLMQKCESFILSNFEMVCNAPDWMDLGAEELCYFLSQSELVVESEYCLWQFVFKWLHSKNVGDDLLERLRMVAPHIRFHLMSPKQLSEIEDTHLYEAPQTKAVLNDVILQAYRHLSLVTEDQRTQFNGRRFRNYLDDLYKTNGEVHQDSYASDYPAINSHRVGDSKLNFQVSVHSNFPVGSRRSNPINSLSLEVSVYPDGYYSSTLYGRITRKTDDFRIRISLPKHADKETVEKYHPSTTLAISVLIYGKKNGLSYVAYSYSTMVVFEPPFPTHDINHVIPIEKLRAKDSLFLVDGNFKARVFVKVADDVESESKGSESNTA